MMNMCARFIYIKNMLSNKTIIFIFELHIFSQGSEFNDSKPTSGYPKLQIYLATQVFKFIWLHNSSNLYGYTRLFKFIWLPNYSNPIGYPALQISWLPLPPCYKIGFLLACSSLATLLEVLYLAFLSHHYG